MSEDTKTAILAILRSLDAAVWSAVDESNRLWASADASQFDRDYADERLALCEAKRDGAALVAGALGLVTRVED
jgi:hypothetical protein